MRSRRKLNTKLVMAASAAYMVLLGMIATFLSPEVLSAFGIEPSNPAVVISSTAGALYLGFGVLNWMARYNAIGGIYSRPVAMGNFFHFMIIAILLFKNLFSTPYTVTFAVGCIANTVFAALFGYILFVGGSPRK